MILFKRFICFLIGHQYKSKDVKRTETDLVIVDFECASCRREFSSNRFFV